MNEGWSTHNPSVQSRRGVGLVKDSFLREMTFTVLWKDSGYSSGPPDLAFRCTCDGPPMTRPYNHGWGLAKHSFRRERTLTMLWKDSRHSSAPTDLLFRCTRDGPNMTRPSSHVGGRHVRPVMAKHSSRKEMTFTVLWKDSEHSSGPIDLAF
ncbi:hypothetical protein TNCT_59411 [Trichonephila clavata]|uniref:Uncharacterized protein n=1 Tax=Trichonephila clavata TaxID=2740835 RepID=A0A8X6K9I1_TRICU|nr:hypothetical protein TNCT_59411 [Trichonephila clavata]